MLASEVSTRRSGLPERLKVFDHSSAPAGSTAARQRHRISNPMRFINLLCRADTPQPQLVRRRYAALVRLVPGKAGFAVGAHSLLLAAPDEVGEANEGAFRERQIQQTGTGREGRTQADLLREQEGREGP